jgi:hypothetical protein
MVQYVSPEGRNTIAKFGRKRRKAEKETPE